MTGDGPCCGYVYLLCLFQINLSILSKMENLKIFCMLWYFKTNLSILNFKQTQEIVK